jgi:putative ABC transport system permease protein
MFSNYLKIALRNMKKQKGYTFINIFGLALGITCFIGIMMYVKYELSYDSFHEKSKRIFRVVMHWEGWNFRGSSDFASTNGAMATVLPHEFQEIESAIRVKNVTSSLKYQENSMMEQGLYADKDFFKTFTFPLISGDRETALEAPFSIVLTKELALKLFGEEDPIGKVVAGLRGFNFKVTGVCEEIPENSHLQFDFVMSFKTMYSTRNDIDTEWGILNYYNYVLLKENVQYKEFEKKLTLLVDKYHEPEQSLRYYFLQPIEDVHLNPQILSRITNSGDIKYIYLFTTIAFLILVIASVNYVNLATSRASLRSKEVGIRKTAGAKRSELIKQFIGESIILTVAALMISLGIIWFIHPEYCNFINLSIPLDNLFNPVDLAGLFVLILLVGFISGCYPSFLLSSFKPTNILRAGSKMSKPQNRFGLRNVLVVFQFLVSVILIFGAMVISKQLNFIKNKDIGYKRENIVTIQLWNTDNENKFETIKQELVKYSSILGAAISDRAPLRASENNRVQVESETGGEMVNLAQTSHFYVDFDFIDVYNIEIKEGRNFSTDFSTDYSQAVIVNETLVNRLGLENPIGKRIIASNIGEAKIIGVVKDFHFASFTYKIGPSVFVYRPRWALRVMSVKIVDSDIQKTLSYIKSTFQSHINDFVFNYQFVEDGYNKIYSSEDRMGSLISVFSTIAILIAVIGLFGLISFIVVQKTREIGIRKVLGASQSNIIFLVSREFIVLVVVANIISLPACYYLMSKWLSNFVYRTDITVWTVLVSFLAAFLIAALTVFYQVMKAANTNPVDAIKYE